MDLENLGHVRHDAVILDVAPSLHQPALVNGGRLLRQNHAGPGEAIPLGTRDQHVGGERLLFRSWPVNGTTKKGALVNVKFF